MEKYFLVTSTGLVMPEYAPFGSGISPFPNSYGAHLISVKKLSIILCNEFSNAVGLWLANTFFMSVSYLPCFKLKFLCKNNLYLLFAYL